MKEFALIFRNNLHPEHKPSPEQMQQVLNDWMNWMGSIAAQNKLADKGNRLSVANACVVGPDEVVTDGPYTEIKEFINGYIVVRTDAMDDAVTIAKGCPVLKMGGNVEVRSIVLPDDNS